MQAGLCQTCSKTTLLVFPRGGSNEIFCFTAGFGYGDLIQPGLLQLQPLLEDEFMELEPIPGTAEKISDKSA